MKTDVLIVGAGLVGSVSARVLAEAGRKVLVIDKRDHIGGNAYDTHDEHDVLIHPYGPHIFHTNAKRVIEWLSRFTDWRFYEHRVLACVDGLLRPIPINCTALNRLYDLSLDEAGATAWLEKVREPRNPIRTGEDVVLNSVGRDLCEKFYRGYTRKQWGLDLSELSAGVAARIPTRTNDDDRYFTDTYQFMPRDGYTAMFRSMLDHSNITVQLSTDYIAMWERLQDNHVVYADPTDAFFDYCYGRLPYRSLRFEHQHMPDTGQLQSVGTFNYPNDHEYTQITELKHLTDQIHSGTSIVRKYLQAEGDPYYPYTTSGK
jgi:UDP-galactopyranose mutase